MSQDQISPKQPRLSGLDREIAVRAIAALARGTPVEAAYQILAGIEALDAGPGSPMIVLWPGDGYEPLQHRAAWHEAERDRILDRLEQFKQAIPSLDRDKAIASGPSQSPRNAPHHSGLRSLPHQEVASAPAPHEEPGKGQPQSSPAQSARSNCASGSDTDAPA